MGLGDALMAAGDCRRVRAERNCGPVMVCDRHGRPTWVPLWERCPDVARPGKSSERVKNAAKCRPYIDYPRSTKERWALKPYRPDGSGPTPARYLIPDEALAAARARWGGRIVVEPNLKPGASPNKQWGLANWQALVEAGPDVPWAQVGAPGITRLSGVERIQTASFDDAIAVLAVSRAAVLPEGGLHHAAAAVGLPAVVLFGGYIGPESTGYELHRNIAVQDPEARGWRVPHPACARAWESIRPDRVLEELRSLL